MAIYPYLPPHSKSCTRSRSMKRQHLTIQPLATATSKDKNPLPRLTFDSLPIELQDEIFSFCLPSFPRFSINEAPIVLTRVCSTWRSIVLSAPRLWSSFEVEIQGSGPSGLLHDNRLLHRMKLWLERSRSCPLSIRLVHNPVGVVSDHRSAQLLAALAPEARRWRYAHFILPAATITQLQPFPPNNFPTLQSFALKVTGLRSSLSDPPLNISTMNIPWHQLIDLDLQLPSNLLALDEALDILSNTVNLKRGALHLKCTWDRSNIHWDKLPLPALEALQLIFHGGNTASTATGGPEVCLVQFLNILSLPKLRMLHLGWLVNSNDTGRWSSAHPDFVTFLRASADTLHELKMTYLPIAENELLECLSQVPRLTHLDLRFALNKEANDPITNQLLVACTIPSFTVSTGTARRRQAQNETFLLPRLEYINLQCHGSHYANTTLLALIQSRWMFNQNSGSGGGQRRPLRSFRLFSMKPVPSEVEEYVKAWHKEGLEIDIECLIIR